MPPGPVTTAARARHGAARALRIAGVSVAVAVALFCTLLLALRFVVYPRIEAHHGDIAALLSRELGRPVEIDSIRTGWDGWNPKLVVHGLRIRDGSQAGDPVLDLPGVSGIVSW